MLPTVAELEQEIADASITELDTWKDFDWRARLVERDRQMVELLREPRYTVEYVAACLAQYSEGITLDCLKEILGWSGSPAR